MCCRGGVEDQVVVIFILMEPCGGASSSTMAICFPIGGMDSSRVGMSSCRRPSTKEENTLEVEVKSLEIKVPHMLCQLPHSLSVVAHSLPLGCSHSYGWWSHSNGSQPHIGCVACSQVWG